MIRRIIPVLLIVVAGVASYVILNNPPQLGRGAPQRVASLSIDVDTISAKPYSVTIDSYGKLQPRTEGELLAQVSGQVVWVNPAFRAGGFFEEGDELLRIDDRDYQAELATQEATLMTAYQTLSEEKARSAQAKADWKRLGNGGKIPDLVARAPQVKAAEATVASAKAAVAQAKLNLERTHIRAPYAGRVLSKSVALGQIITTSTSLATLYAVDVIEVRLPLQARDLAYIDLPERYRFNDKVADNLPSVTLISTLVNKEEWKGEVVMTEGAIDEDSRQLYVIAQITDPYGEGNEDKTPLKIGQYVQAKIQGKTLERAIVIPNRVIYQGTYVYVFENDAVTRREVSIAWQNEQEAIIASGLVEGDTIVTTALGQVISGTPAQLRSQEQEGTRPNKTGGRPETRNAVPATGGQAQ
ncbi:efflux RND transporter periplasmic adaptor subunit [Neptunomonas phycophila]|uniref:efflux RND transporter periplasmic adaptor subunit n=1 Tax=Neptunomonas phycophila TaxID=1572645 RepID=UPI0023F7CC74|nr:efflux RND transporter periplasmic adaptor subunit [Neptunomonas phycophila]